MESKGILVSAFKRSGLFIVVAAIAALGKDWSSYIWALAWAVVTCASFWSFLRLRAIRGQLKK